MTEYERIYSDPTTEETFDEDEGIVICEKCGERIVWYQGRYICPACGHEHDRADFFAYIGATEFVSRCLTCSENYPVCKDCCGFF